LLKYKEFQDDEFEILSVNVGKNQTIAESVTIRLNNGKDCNATLAFTDERCKEILENKENYIGKTATVRYFGETNDGLLRFPVVKVIDRENYE
jgi:small nuclear ribonucleoprotein (snRNP)-like protein